jgi:hypothetical protein
MVAIVVEDDVVVLVLDASNIVLLHSRLLLSLSSRSANLPNSLFCDASRASVSPISPWLSGAHNNVCIMASAIHYSSSLLTFLGSGGWSFFGQRKLSLDLYEFLASIEHLHRLCFNPYLLQCCCYAILNHAS